MKKQSKIVPKLTFNFNILEEQDIHDFTKDFEISKHIKKQMNEKEIKLINLKDKNHGRRNNRNSKLF